MGLGARQSQVDKSIPYCAIHIVHYEFEAEQVVQLGSEQGRQVPLVLPGPVFGAQTVQVPVELGK
jgi:hypothetical protein